MANHHDSNSTAEHAHGHSFMPYVATLAVLLILTAITVFAAGFDFGSGNVVIALLIATIKASLVALVFMHLRNDKPINAVIAVAGFLFLGLLLLFTLTDIDNRDDLQPSTIKVPLAPPAGAAAAPAPAAEPAPAGEHK